MDKNKVMYVDKLSKLLEAVKKMDLYFGDTITITDKNYQVKKKIFISRKN